MLSLISDVCHRRRRAEEGRVFQECVTFTLKTDICSKEPLAWGFVSFFPS